MKRRVLAIFFLLLFLHGLLGFSLTRHYCTHSGKEIFVLGNEINHVCEKETEATACCIKSEFEKPIACCINNEAYLQSPCNVNTEKGETDDCCSNQQTYFHIELSAVKSNPSFQIILPVIYLISEIHLFEFISPSVNSKKSFCFEIPPLLSSSHQPSFLCVFRI